MILEMKKILIILLLPVTLFARENHFSLGLEAFNQFTGKAQVNNEGALNWIRPTLLINTEYFIKIKEKFSLHPNISFSIPLKDGDKYTTAMTVVGSFSAGWTLGDFLLQAGLGLELNLVWGGGGTELLNNGNSYDEFWLPSRVKSARNIFMNFSGDWFFVYNWAARLGAFVYNFESSHKRSLSYYIGVHYHFGTEK
jgi:hypothetical protein